MCSSVACCTAPSYSTVQYVPCFIIAREHSKRCSVADLGFQRRFKCQQIARAHSFLVDRVTDAAGCANKHGRAGIVSGSPAGSNSSCQCIHKRLHCCCCLGTLGAAPCNHVLERVQFCTFGWCWRSAGLVPSGVVREKGRGSEGINSKPGYIKKCESDTNSSGMVPGSLEMAYM